MPQIVKREILNLHGYIAELPSSSSVTRAPAIAPRAHAVREHAERRLLGVFRCLAHVITSEPSRMRGKKSE